MSRDEALTKMVTEMACWPPGWNELELFGHLFTRGEYESRKREIER